MAVFELPPGETAMHVSQCPSQTVPFPYAARVVDLPALTNEALERKGARAMRASAGLDKAAANGVWRGGKQTARGAWGAARMGGGKQTATATATVAEGRGVWGYRAWACGGIRVHVHIGSTSAGCPLPVVPVPLAATSSYL